MLNLKLILTPILFLVISVTLTSQVKVKSLDPEMMKDKVLYIPDYNPEDPVIQRWVDKGKDEKVSQAQFYAELWQTVMEESSWDATPYEIRQFDARKLQKAKDPTALLLRLYSVRTDCGQSGGYVTNFYASITMTGPKKRVIATALINDLDWWNRYDLRLIVNMLSNSLNEAIEAYEDDKGSKYSATRKASKKVLVDFMDGVEDKTFLVVKSAWRDETFNDLLNDSDMKDRKKKKLTKRQEKYKTKDQDVAEALAESWKMSEYEMVYPDELIQYRDDLSEDHFFWINIEINTCSIISFGANRNHLFSTNGDKVLAAFGGKGRMKPATVENIQTKLVNRYERYQKQLAK